MIWWPLSAAVVVITGVAVGAVSVHDRFGRPLLAVVSARVAHAMGMYRGSTRYQAGPLSQVPHGRCRLPGLAAAIEAVDVHDGLGRTTGVLWHRHRALATAVVEVCADGVGLLDAEHVDQRVAGYGEWLAGLAHEPGVVAATVTVCSAPDSGARLHGELAANLVAEAPAVAAEVLAAIDKSYRLSAAQISCYVAITWSAAARHGRRQVDQVARHVGQRMPAVTAGLAVAGGGRPWPLSVAELAGVCRGAYDPGASSPGDVEVAWEDAGPVAAEEHYDWYRHDSGRSASFVMAQAPSGHVTATALAALLAPQDDVPMKRVTLAYRPLAPAAAAGIVERDRLDAQARATAQRVSRAADSLSVSAAARSAVEQAQGAGVVQFSLMATATVTGGGDLDAARVAMLDAGLGSRVLLRPAYGSQAAVFAASLPLGLVLPEFAMVPRSILEMI
jgi:hypothetical protein